MIGPPLFFGFFVLSIPTQYLGATAEQAILQNIVTIQPTNAMAG
jgi:hypothetical protein